MQNGDNFLDFSQLRLQRHDRFGLPDTLPLGLRLFCAARHGYFYWTTVQVRQNGNMTIDERLEKLVERHEALTQSVELLGAMHRATEADQKKTSAEIRKLARLVRVIVVDHEARLLELEGDGQEG